MTEARPTPENAGATAAARPPACGPAGFSSAGAATISIVSSMALAAVGNGLMFAYIPVKLGAEGFAPAWAGGILTGLSAGGIAGCLLTGPLVRRVGHARAFAILSALIVLSNAAIGAGIDPDSLTDWLTACVADGPVTEQDMLWVLRFVRD